MPLFFKQFQKIIVLLSATQRTLTLQAICIVAVLTFFLSGNFPPGALGEFFSVSDMSNEVQGGLFITVISVTTNVTVHTKHSSKVAYNR